VLVVDTTVISNFAKTGFLDLMKAILGDEGVTTVQVLDEFDVGVQRGRYPNLEIPLKVLELTEEERELYNLLNQSLGKGEASCIAVAKFRNGILLSDDYDARKKARLLGVKVSGTIGVLVLGVRRGIIKLEDANSILNEMIKKGFYSPIKRLEEVMPSSSP
jgi:predicted nucleic acid-binding protein